MAEVLKLPQGLVDIFLRRKGMGGWGDGEMGGGDGERRWGEERGQGERAGGGIMPKLQRVSLRQPQWYSSNEETGKREPQMILSLGLGG